MEAGDNGVNEAADCAVVCRRYARQSFVVVGGRATMTSCLIDRRSAHRALPECGPPR